MRGKRFKAAVQHVFDIKGMAKPEDKTWKEVAWWVDMHEEDSEIEWDRATQQAKHQAARHGHNKGGTRTHQRDTPPRVTQSSTRPTEQG